MIFKSRKERTLSSDQEILRIIRRQDKSKQDRLTIKRFYESFVNIGIEFFKKNQIENTDAKSLAVDSLGTLLRKIEKMDFILKGPLRGYYYGIMENYRKRYFSAKHNSKLQFSGLEIDPGEPDYSDPEAIFLKKEKADLVRKLLNLLKGKCREILELHILGYDNHEIAEKVGYKSAAGLKVAKHRCHKKLETLATENDFFNQYFN